jgi:Uma2 family endonuclease
VSVALLTEEPLAPPAEIGPYRKADYLGLPEQPRCELIYGRFYMSPSPAVRHQVVLQLLWLRLREIARPLGGLVLLAPMDVTLADHSVVQPDLLYLRAESRGLAVERVEGPPDLLVEVLSPGTVRRDRVQKLALYAESGVREYWLVDPRERQIEFLVNEAGRFVVALPAGREYRSPALSEVHLDLESFWAEVAAELPEA